VIQRMSTDGDRFLSLIFVNELEDGTYREGDIAPQAWRLDEVPNGEITFDVGPARMSWGYNWDLIGEDTAYFRVKRVGDGDVLVEPVTTSARLRIVDQMVFEKMWPEFVRLLAVPRKERKRDLRVSRVIRG